MVMSRLLKKSVAYAVIMGQISLPVQNAFAEDDDPFAKMNRVCEDTLKQIKDGKLKTAGDAQAGYCANAEIWRRTYNAEKGKSIAFGSATTALLGMGITQTSMKQVGMRAAITKAQAAATSVDLNLTNTSGWSTTAATTEASAYALDASAAAAAATVVGAAAAAALEAQAAAAHAKSYSDAAMAVESAISAAEFAAEAYRSLNQVKQLESGIKKMAKVCKYSSGTAVVAQLAVDTAVTGQLNKVREEYDLAKDNLGYIDALGRAMGQGLTVVGGTSLIDSIGDKSGVNGFEEKMSLAEKSSEKTAADLEIAKGYAASVKAATAAAKAEGKAAAGMVSATAMGAAAVTAATSAMAAAKAAIAAAEAIKASSEGGKSCYTNSLGMGILTTTSLTQMDGAKRQMKSNVDSASNLKEDNKLTSNNFLNSGLTQNNNSNNAVNSPTNGTAITSEGCTTADNLECLGNHDAAASAITSSPDLMSEITKTMGGKSLGSLIKDFKGNSAADLANYLANQSSVDPKITKAALGASEKIAKENRFAEKYKPTGYVGTNRKVASKSDDDFDINKMMSGIMGKMGAGEDKKDQKAGDTDYVFRQMELMTPAQIQENKGISLFTRVAYRYRKKNADLEQMNSSRVLDREVSSEKK